MRIPVAALIAAASLAACGPEPAAPQVTAEDAVVTLPAVTGRPGAGYFSLHSNWEGVRLVGISSPQAERVELHEAGMRETASVALTSGEALRFEPGGRHAMLYGLDPALRPGARIRLTFRFEGAPEATAEAEVRAPGDVHPGH
jgi:hypothetical protein